MTRFKYTLLLLCIGVVNVVVGQSNPFKAGNIVVYRVGDGTTNLSFNASPVYLDEYTPDGILVQSVLMPTTASGSNNTFTAHGRITTEGMLNLSGDGKYLVVPGTNTTLGTTTTTAAVIGLVDFNAKINTSTAVTDFIESGQIPSTAVSADGSGFWLSGTGAIRYTTPGSSTSVLIGSTGSQQNDLTLESGQLYASSGINPPGVYKVGSGAPTTSGQTLTGLTGLPADISGPGQFAFADLDASVPGVDVLYVASTGNIISPTIGIRKFSLVGGTWVSNGSVGGDIADSYYMGLTIRVTGNVVTIFSTRRGANRTNTIGGELVKLVDNSGYNGTLTGAPAVIAAVPTANFMAYRGVALVPQPAPFKAGNIVVYRVGDGTTNLSFNASPVYLDEYTPDGILVQSILMPTTAGGGNNTFTAHGRITTEGMLNLSGDGKYLVAPGTNTTLGTTTTTAAVIGLVDFNAKINTSTAVTDFTESGQIPSTAVSADGSGFWLSGTGAIRYTTPGSSTSVLISSTGSQQNDLKLESGQLYTSSGINPPGVYKVGSGVPVKSGQTLTGLAGLPADISGPGQFAFADLDANVPGVDVLYVASTGNIISPTIGIRKFSLVGGTWVNNGSVGGDIADSYYMGLTIRVTGNVVTIFSTRRGGNRTNTIGGELVKLVDNSGYNGTLTGAPTVIAAVPTANFMAYRGVVRVPLGCPFINTLQAPNISATQATLVWKDPNGGGSNFEYAVTTSATPPASGTVISGTSANISGLANNTTYYAYVRTKCSATSVSEWSTVSFVTGCKPPAAPLVNINISSSGAVTIKWNKVFGAASYEYFISASSTPPGAGSATADTAITITNLNSVTQYYVHVRSNCGAGTFSTWTTKAFATECFMPTTRIAALPGNTGVSWNKINNAVRYEYSLSYSPVKPIGGSYTSDTQYVFNKTTEGTAYYFHVRSICSNGSVSDWSTIYFATTGLQAFPNPVKETLHIKLEGVAMSGGEITIGDAMGRIVYRLKLNSNTETIDARAWAPGIYLIKYSDGQQQFSVRILKQ